MGLTETAAIDALHGYEFGALWIKAEEDQAAYAETAGARIGELKIASQILTDMEEKLRNYFDHYKPQ